MAKNAEKITITEADFNYAYSYLKEILKLQPALISHPSVTNDGAEVAE